MKNLGNNDLKSNSQYQNGKGDDKGNNLFIDMEKMAEINDAEVIPEEKKYEEYKTQLNGKSEVDKTPTKDSEEFGFSQDDISSFNYTYYTPQQSDRRTRQFGIKVTQKNTMGKQ